MDLASVAQVVRDIEEKHLDTTLDGFDGVADRDVVCNCRVAVTCSLTSETGERARAAAAAVIQACEERKRAAGWDSPSWQEALIFAHLCTAAVELIAGAAACPQPRLSLAMRHVDLAILIGSPEHLSTPLVQACEPVLREANTQIPVKDLALPRGFSVELEESGHSIEKRDPQQLAPAEFKALFWKTNTPVVLQGEAGDWPAATKWPRLKWWVETFGHRTVPLEVGVFGEEGWHEEAVTLATFVERYMVPSVEHDADGLATHLLPASAGSVKVEGQVVERIQARREHAVAYMAQHRLVDQLPQLLEDVRPPRCWGGSWEVMNVWMGTSGTVTPLHYDSMDNFLCQVAGYKYVRLYAWSQTPLLHACEESTGQSSAYSRAQGNISAVDVGSPDFEKHPMFRQAAFTEVILKPGEALFIPAKCWHWVCSLTTSLSVNFWF